MKCQCDDDDDDSATQKIMCARTCYFYARENYCVCVCSETGRSHRKLSPKKSTQILAIICMLAH